MFANLEKLAPDPILGVTIAFRADKSDRKVDLGVGVYRDAEGQTPVPAAVREAEQAVLASQTTKVYVGPLGNPDFNQRIAELALGPLAATLRGRTATIQTVGGCGALRIGAEIVRAARPETSVHVSTPTWANHEPLLGSSGLPLKRYPYYDAVAHRVEFDRMMDAIGSAPAGDSVLLHACCHNPTGADLTRDQWLTVAETVQRRGLADPCRAGPRDAARDFVLEELRPLPRKGRRPRRDRRERGRGRGGVVAPGPHCATHVLDAARPWRGGRSARARRRSSARVVGR